MRVLVTGHAGFIGFHTAKHLLARGDDVVGVDVINDYYQPALKHARLAELERLAADAGRSYVSLRKDIADSNAINAIFSNHEFDRVIHLAAQAGVRHSISHPGDYVHSNLIAFTNILEACRHAESPHLTYASTSSVYGGNTKMPYSERHNANHPLQFYAATKRANELMAHSYSHLFGLPTTGLRFFTVYGPWGRPDMAPILFARNIEEGRPIKVYNYGNHSRDFTFVDDIVRGVLLSTDKIPEPNPDWDAYDPDPSTSSAPWRLFNIGNSSPVKILDFITQIASGLGKEPILEMLPIQPGDVPNTFADVLSLREAVGYVPQTSLKEGVSAFLEWFKTYYYG